MTTFSFDSDKTADGKPSLGFEPSDRSWKYQLSGRNPILLTSSPLGVSSVYTQTPAIDSTAYPQDNSVAGHVFSDQPGTLYLEVSADGSNWDVQTSLAVNAGIPVFLPFTAIQGRYYRFRYVNGSTAQTAFRLEQIQANQMGSGNDAVGSKADQAVTDPALSATEISLLKGILKQLQGAGSGSTPVVLTGSSVVNGKLQVDIGGATFTGTIGDMQAKTLAVTFQNAASAVGNGTPFDAAAFKTIALEVSGSGASRTIVFEATGPSGNYIPVQGVKLSDFSMATQTTGINELWQFDVTGLFNFRARISAIFGTAEVASLDVAAAPTANGNVTVTLDNVATNVAVQTGAAQVESLQITNATGATAAGNVTITLDGVATTVAVATTDNTPALVATKIRGTAFTGWTTGGTGDTVTFTSNTKATRASATYNAGTTGAAGTMTRTTAGANPDTATDVATKIRNAAFTGWATGGTGTNVTFTSTTDGNKVDAAYSAGTTGVTGTMSTTIQGAPASVSVKGKAVA